MPKVEMLDNGDRLVRCDFQCSKTLTYEEISAIGSLLMDAMLRCEWTRDASVSTRGKDGSFSFVIKDGYVFPPLP